MIVHSWLSFEITVILSFQGQGGGVSVVELAGFGNSQGHLYKGRAVLVLIVVVFIWKDHHNAHNNVI